MSRVPTNASEAGTQVSIGAMDGVGEKTGFTPAGMGLADLGIVGAGSNGIGGLGAGLGIGMGGVRDQEEERRRKTEAIVSMLGTKWGRVCPEGVERAAKRVGLECLWEEGRGGAKRTLSIAGSDVLVDVEFVGEEVQGVTLELAASGQEVGKRAPEGAEVLKKDLKGEEKGHVFLDAFVGNLEKLARMDKLAEGGISCFDAVEGVRAALERVFEWELGKRREKCLDANTVMFEREVLCRGSGRPKIHARGRVGLAVQYWVDRSLLPPEPQEPGAMDIDTDGTNPEDELKVYSAIFECEASGSSLYPSIRVSDSWVPTSIEKAVASESNPFNLQDSPIDWQEPPPTLLKPPRDSAMDLEAQDPLLQERTPSVRFIARFEPPVVMPLQTAIDIHQSVGSPLSQDSIQPTTYESLLFADTTPPPTPQDQRTAAKTIISYDSSGNTIEHRHKYTLFPMQPDYGCIIDSLPFSHPRQIIEILPILRQWALLGSLLRRSLVPDALPESLKKANNDEAFDLDVQLDESMTVEEELAALLASSSSPPTENGIIGSEATALPIDITLSTSASPPGIGIVWAQGEKLRSVNFGVGLNGTIEVYGEEQEKGPEKEKMKKTLEIAEDVGVVVEWLMKNP